MKRLILLMIFSFSLLLNLEAGVNNNDVGEMALKKKVAMSLKKKKSKKKRFRKGMWNQGVLSVGINIGIAFMQTDLAGHKLGDFGWNDIERAKPIFSVFMKNQLNDYFEIGAEVGFTSYWAEDAWIEPTGPRDPGLWRKNRNLSAGSNIYFANITATLTPFYIEVGRYSMLEPFIGVGVGFFTFNPYTYYEGEKIYLQKLQIEDVDYNLWAFSFPVIGGIKFRNDKYSCSIFTGWDVTYTDYVDDISTNDMDFSKKDGLVRELIWRTDEIDPEAVMPSRDGRGDPTDYDQLWYFKVQWGYYLNTKGKRSGMLGGRKKGKVRCPGFKKAKRKGFVFL